MFRLKQRGFDSNFRCVCKQSHRLHTRFSGGAPEALRWSFFTDLLPSGVVQRDPILLFHMRHQ